MEYKIFHNDEGLGTISSDGNISLSGNKTAIEPIVGHLSAFFDNALPEGERYKNLVDNSKSPSQMDHVAMLDELPGNFSVGNPDRRMVVPFPVIERDVVELKTDIPVNMFFVNSKERNGTKPSFSGYQDKFVAKAVLEGEKVIISPIDAGKEIGNVIMKPGLKLPFIAENEFICMRLAQKIGLDVPSTFLVKHPDPAWAISHLCVERFDLDHTEQTSKKRDVAEFATLLNLPSNEKYSVKTESFFEFAKEKLCGEDLRKLAKAYVFGVIVGNGDMHIKNFSVFVEAGKYRLAPIYDMLNTKIHGFNDTLALPMKTPRPHNPTMKMFIDFMESYIRVETIRELVDGVKEHLPKIFPLVASEDFVAQRLMFCKKLGDSILKNVKNIEGDVNKFSDKKLSNT